MSGGYEVVEVPGLGVYVLGGVPVDEVLALAKVWEERGLDVVDQKVAKHFGASWCQTTKEGSRLWRAELGIKEEKP